MNVTRLNHSGTALVNEGGSAYIKTYDEYPDLNPAQFSSGTSGIEINSTYTNAVLSSANSYTNTQINQYALSGGLSIPEVIDLESNLPNITSGATQIMNYVVQNMNVTSSGHAGQVWCVPGQSSWTKFVDEYLYLNGSHFTNTASGYFINNTYTNTVLSAGSAYTDAKIAALPSIVPTTVATESALPNIAAGATSTMHILVNNFNTTKPGHSGQVWVTKGNSAWTRIIDDYPEFNTSHFISSGGTWSINSGYTNQVMTTIMTSTHEVISGLAISGYLPIPQVLHLETSLPDITSGATSALNYVIENMNVTSSGHTGQAWCSSGSTEYIRFVDNVDLDFVAEESLLPSTEELDPEKNYHLIVTYNSATSKWVNSWEEKLIVDVNS